ncbi:Hpt domain-containing protein [Rheinheimera marina]|uniref:Hpt domain-containing protein n=1 Tax=Rheinheimera marina TaxID=1774958 RepID=A0ABV9JJ15_9GAMM
MDLTQAKSLFIEEASGLLASMESCLLEIESGEATVAEHIDAIFRAAHTIKGSAGLFGFDAVVAFTHNLESVLDKVRAAQLTMDAELINLMFGCQDHLSGMIQQLQDADFELDLQHGQWLLQQLAAYMTGGAAAQTEPPPAEEMQQVEHEHWQIDIEYGADVFRDGLKIKAHKIKSLH